VAAAEPDVVQAAVVAQGQFAVAIDPVVPDAVVNHPGSDGDSFYWIPTPAGSDSWAA
jgi:hypothetical protein